ncbi:MAG: hypothetical protein AAB386_03735 [Patescibacteria group bacterium]
MAKKKEELLAEMKKILSEIKESQRHLRDITKRAKTVYVKLNNIEDTKHVDAIRKKLGL